MEKLPNLSTKHKLFADHYLKTGNASESAKIAGSKSKNLHCTGYQWLQREDIKLYVEIKRNELKLQQDNELVADIKEIMQFLTDNVRDKSNKVNNKDKIKSAELLAKMLGAFDTKKDDPNESNDNIVIINDLPDDTEDDIDEDFDDSIDDSINYDDKEDLDSEGDNYDND